MDAEFHALDIRRIDSGCLLTDFRVGPWRAVSEKMQHVVRLAPLNRRREQMRAFRQRERRVGKVRVSAHVGVQFDVPEWLARLSLVVAEAPHEMVLAADRVRLHLYLI